MPLTIFPPTSAIFPGRFHEFLVGDRVRITISVIRYQLQPGIGGWGTIDILVLWDRSFYIIQVITCSNDLSGF
jgi:hypothetical protein